jgi:hypothetical protein
MKTVTERAGYPELLEHPFLQHHSKVNTNISPFVSDVLDNSTDADEKESGTNKKKA